MNLETFGGFDTSESMSESSFEAFKEKMKRATAQIAAIKKEEKKQKKNEDELFRILLKFIKSSNNNELVLLISRALEKNIPSNFILAIIILGNEEIQREIGESLQLTAPAKDEKALIFFTEEKTFDLDTRIALDAWIKNIMFQAEENPQKLLRTAYDVVNDEKIVAKAIVELYSFVVSSYLKKKNIEFDPIQTTKLAEFMLSGILKKTEENLVNRAQIEA